MLKQVRVFIKGDVIGVGFRAWTQYWAKKSSIKGWVKNSGDQVEAFLQADKETLDKFIEKLRQGPPVSQVEDVKVVWENTEKLFDNFEIVK